jgi:hypothetical protein
MTLAAKFRALHLYAAVLPRTEDEIILALYARQRLTAMGRERAALLVGRYVYGLTMEQCAAATGRSPWWARKNLVEATLLL